MLKLFTKKTAIKNIFTIFIAFSILFSSVFSSYSAFATNDFYSGNDILFYDSSENSECSSSAAASSDGSDVTMIGDSITYMGQESIKGLLPKINIDAISGTWFSKNDPTFGESGITRLKSKANPGNIIVFAMGTNGGVTESDIKELVSVAGNDRKIILMSLYHKTADYSSSNQIIKQAATNYSNISIADWNQAVLTAGADNVISEDGVHPNTAGIKLFTETIRDAVNKQTSIVSYKSDPLEIGTDSANNSTYTRLMEATKQYGETAMAMQKLWGTPWEVVLAQMQIESGVGTAGHAAEGAINNWLGITGSGDTGLSYTSSGGRKWAIFTSVEKSIEAWAGEKVLRNGYYDDAFPYIDPDNYDLEGFLKVMLSHYAPSSDGNNENTYLNSILSLINGPIKEVREEMGWPSSAEYAQQENINIGGQNPIGSETISASTSNTSLSSSTGCVEGEGGSKIASIAVDLAWPDKDHYAEVNPAFQKAAEALGRSSRTYCSGRSEWSGNSSLDFAQDCGVFVSVVVQTSGVDPNFPDGSTSIMESYMRESNLWKEVPNQGNTSNLLPGDIFVVNNDGGGHTYIYVGDGNIASASLCGRTGNLSTIDWEGYNDYNKNYSIFRHIGSAATTGTTGSFAGDISNLETEKGVQIGVAVTAIDDKTGSKLKKAGTWSGGRAWSTIKVPLSIAAIQHKVSMPSSTTDPYGATCQYSSYSNAILDAINKSNNCAAWSLWTALGGDGSDAAQLINDVLISGSDQNTKVVSSGDGSSLTSGKTSWLLTDQAIFAANMSSLSGASEVLAAMKTHSADDGSSGLNIISGAATKGGWGSSSGNIARQFGIVPIGDDKCSAIAIGVSGAASSSDGFQILTEITNILKNNSSDLPSGTCPKGI